MTRALKGLCEMRSHSAKSKVGNQENVSVPQLGVPTGWLGRCLLGTAPSSEVMTQGEMTEQLWFVVDKGSFGPQKLKVKPDSHTFDP